MMSDPIVLIVVILILLGIRKRKNESD